jgi:hypothetical protein
MSYTIAALADPHLDLDSEHILSGGLPDRRILLAALAVAAFVRGRDRNGRGGGWNYDVAVEWNAMPDGWELGLSAMGSEYPSESGIHFTPAELHTVIQFARYVNAREAGIPDRTHGPWVTADEDDQEEPGS